MMPIGIFKPGSINFKLHRAAVAGVAAAVLLGTCYGLYSGTAWALNASRESLQGASSFSSRQGFIDKATTSEPSSTSG
jgi:hypothetical protein